MNNKNQVTMTCITLSLKMFKHFSLVFQLFYIIWIFGKKCHATVLVLGKNLCRRICSTPVCPFPSSISIRYYLYPTYFWILLIHNLMHSYLSQSIFVLPTFFISIAFLVNSSSFPTHSHTVCNLSYLCLLLPLFVLVLL